MSKLLLWFKCVDCSNVADLKCFRCGGPWCGKCRDAMKSSRYDDLPCHTCRNRMDA